MNLTKDFTGGAHMLTFHKSVLSFTISHRLTSDSDTQTSEFGHLKLQKNCCWLWVGVSSTGGWTVTVLCQGVRMNTAYSGGTILLFEKVLGFIFEAVDGPY